jgi:3-phosphoshikimate 1-carboxyvinyltransferase
VRVQGRIEVPGDKSISHRALILSALAEGRSRVFGLLSSADVRATAGVLRTLGVRIDTRGEETTIEGVGLRGLVAPDAELDCGNSGTTTRLMAGVVAAQPFAARFVGDASLMRRPMRRIQRPLERMGARVELTDAGTLPMTVRGAELGVVDWDTGTASAQVKGAIVLAGLCARVPVTVREPVLSRDHTERMLAARGVVMERDGTRITLRPVDSLPALEMTVPRDPSSAAFFVALAALARAGSLELPGVCVNPTRTGFLDVVRRMGASIELRDGRHDGGEETATIGVAPASLRATTVEARDVPAMIDEIPMLACMAARAEGQTVITGAGELRVKESDRITAVVDNLRALGVQAEELPDGLVVQGSDRPLAGRAITHGDHRLAMAFGVLGALPGCRVEVDDPGCVAVSYPEFWSDLRRAVASASPAA